jgi:hypothetical protein
VPSKPVPIRFHDYQWALVQAEAQEMGITAAELVRVATIAYVAFCIARRGGPRVAAIAELQDAALRVVIADPRYALS